MTSLKNVIFLSFFFCFLSQAQNKNLDNSQLDSQKIYLKGVEHYQGKFSVKDHDLSIKLLTQAANNKYAPAQYYLGVIYYDKKQYGESLFWLTAAADEDHRKAKYLLAWLFFEGQAVEKSFKNNKEAYKNLIKAFEQDIKNILQQED